MDKKSFTKYIEKMFTYNTLPTIMDFIRIPNLSPGFDKEWKTNGLLLKAANLLISFAQSLNLKGMQTSILQDKDYSPMVYIEFESSRPNDTRTIILYAHLDKQPWGTGWDSDKSPIKPVIENNHLYGRGSADDGYASFSLLTAIKACQEHNCPLPRICCMFECGEETTEDLNYYFNKLLPVFGDNVIAFLPLDSGCGDYDRLWITSSLRGFLEFRINIQNLDTDCNYGPEVSGKIADNLFILRKIEEGVVDCSSMEVKISEFFPKEIPEDKLAQLEKEVEIVKDTFWDLIPLYPGVDPIKTDVKEVLINNRWKPTFSILGIDNCPQIEDNGFSAKNSLTAQISMRLPPRIDIESAIQALKKTINDNIYFGTKVSLTNFSYCEGWELDNLSEKLQIILNAASKEFFGNELVFRGEGGSIPFLTYFKNKYPKADIICTGICGVDSNEHGPNENLNLDACKKLILVLCNMLVEI